MPRMKHVSNPTEAMLAEHAANHGYLPLRASAAPSAHHSATWQLQEGELLQLWQPKPLDEVRVACKQQIETWKEEALMSSARVFVPELGWHAVYDSNAMINLLGLLGMQLESVYIDADDVPHALSAEDLSYVNAAIQAYRASIYTRKMELFARCDAAETVEQLAALTWEPPTPEQESDAE